MDDIHKVPKPHYNHFHGLQHTFEDTQQLLRATPRVIPSATMPAPVKSKSRKFRRAYALVPFTIAVLCVGAYFGARLVSFAGSVSTSDVGFYKSLGNNIGATLGGVIPGLKNLDDTQVAADIKNHKTINVLMLGYGGEGHDGTYLTDTMMLISLDTQNNKATFIPVPRDLWVKIPTKGFDGGYAKINSAFSTGMDSKNYPNKLPEFSGVNGGGNLSKYEVSQVLGAPVDYYVSMDFYAFKKVVDTLGGVEINVDTAFTDYSYPTGDNNVNSGLCVADDIPDSMITQCRYKKLHFDAGLQYMDGSRALEYARSRHALGTEGSDFARSKRQQKLIAAIEQKALSVGALTKVFSLMDSVQGHFKTDLSIAEIKDLSDYISGVDFQTAQRLSLTDEKLLISSTSADGQWILIPADPADAQTGQWNSINNFIQQKLRNSE